MNGTNRALYWAGMGVVSVYVALSLIASAWQTYGGDGTELRAMSLVSLALSLFDAGSSSSHFDSLFVGLSGAFGPGYADFLDTVYFDPLQPLSDAIGNDQTLKVIFMGIGASLVIGGMASKTWLGCNGPAGDPRQLLLTHRKYAVIWAAELPWNIFRACFKRHYVLVAVPIAFLPMILPFAVIGTVVSLAVFLVERGAMGADVRLAAKRDREAYQRNTGFGICPQCRARFEYPRASCQRCKLVFDYPVPDGHGARMQTCNNGHRIPCTNAKGARSTLTAVCPRCGALIKTREAKPHAFALVGATGSGKTALMLSAVDYVCNQARERGITTEESEGISKEARAKPDAASPTKAGEVPSECLFVRRRNLGERELVLNDISGEEFEPEESRDLFEEYYQYGEGIIFAIDPAEVVNVHISKSPTKGSKTTPKSTFDTFFQIYSIITGAGPASVSKVPFAVVLTKASQPNVANLIRGKSPEEFLRENGQEEFLDTVSSLFSDVRYFVADSVDDPAAAAAPLKWMMEKCDRELHSALFGTPASGRIATAGAVFRPASVPYEAAGAQGLLLVDELPWPLLTHEVGGLPVGPANLLGRAQHDGAEGDLSLADRVALEDPDLGLSVPHPDCEFCVGTGFQAGIMGERLAGDLRPPVRGVDVPGPGL